MFLSEPLCILTAGPTADGRNIDPKIIDDIAETYNTATYTARINEDHYAYSYKFGSVYSVEKRDHQLFARLKPNSYLLNMVERGQLLHPSCEFVEDFAGTGKAYLTGLALTDNPASLGTTQIQLSAQGEDKVQVIGPPIDPACFSARSNPNDDGDNRDDVSIIRKFFNLLKSAPDAQEQLSQPKEPEEMSQETEALLKQSTEQNQALSSQLATLIETLSSQKTDPPNEVQTAPEQPEAQTTLATKVDQLASQLSALSEKLSTITNETPRTPAGSGSNDMYL